MAVRSSSVGLDQRGARFGLKRGERRLGSEGASTALRDRPQAPSLPVSRRHRPVRSAQMGVTAGWSSETPGRRGV
jgi:hypothetical protein